MVLEKVFRPKELIREPILLMFYSAIVAIISALTSFIFFPDSASILTIAFITIAFTFFIRRVYDLTEKEIVEDNVGFLTRYRVVIGSYFKIFVALIIVFTLIYVFLPQPYRLILFKDQIQTLKEISALRAEIVATVGNFWLVVNDSTKNIGLLIFLNNLEVLFAILLLSFVYGAGAIFLISYQASILGAIFGENIINLFGHYNNLGIYGHIFAFLHGSYLALGVIPHGIFEITAYFLAAVAGGIISATLVGHFAHSKQALIRTVRDVVVLVVLSVLCLLLGAVIETYLIVVG